MKEFDDLVGVMARLRAPDGCPWDREQTHASIRKYVIEEAYEVAEAIDHEEPQELCAELGDLLLQVVFHARMAEEAGQFTVKDVCRGVVQKLERRHPHVFGDAGVRDAAEVSKRWEEIKKEERGPDASVIDGVPRALPALQRAERISEKAARTGFDWPDAEAVLEKLDEERRELLDAVDAGDPDAIRHEVGDLLLTVANLARKLEAAPEESLAQAVDRFEQRFRRVEKTARLAEEDLGRLPLDELEKRWQAAKRALAAESGKAD